MAVKELTVNSFPAYLTNIIEQKEQKQLIILSKKRTSLKSIYKRNMFEPCVKTLIFV